MGMFVFVEYEKKVECQKEFENVMIDLSKDHNT